MDVTADLVAPCSAEELFRWVEDLSRYPEWLDIVPRAVPAEADPADPGPAWSVDLRGRLGPLARSKRLRMARTAHDAPRHVRFERREHDDRQHATWLLEAGVEPSAAGSALTMHLHYGGRLAGAVVERMLADEIRRSRPRLLALLAT